MPNVTCWNCVYIIKHTDVPADALESRRKCLAYCIKHKDLDNPTESFKFYDHDEMRAVAPECKSYFRMPSGLGPLQVAMMTLGNSIDAAVHAREQAEATQRQTEAIEEQTRQRARQQILLRRILAVPLFLWSLLGAVELTASALSNLRQNADLLPPAIACRLQPAADSVPVPDRSATSGALRLPLLASH